ncbi:MAG: hypothetical protein ACREEL_14350 [Stellaceae bacterium]
MVVRHLLVFVLSALLAAVAGCTFTHVTYVDPVAYCAAIGTIDHPDDLYVGSRSPEWIADALTRELHPGPAFNDNAALPIVWRCAGGKVVACSIGFGMPCDERGDTSLVPTRAILDFCRAFPDVDRPLPALAGQLSVYAWGCHAGWPHVIGVRRDLDAQRYLLRYWFRVTPSATFSAELDTPASIGTGRPARRSTAGSVSST